MGAGDGEIVCRCMFGLWFTLVTVICFAMYGETNLLVISTRSSVCCANLILGGSVNFVHKNTSRNVASEQ